MHIDSPQPSRLVFEKVGSDTPLVTIAIPTYRRDDMLAEALTSALQQDTSVPIEIIVVDNDPDSAANLLTKVDLTTSRHAVRYFVNHTNLGMFGNWNQCISLARGRWLTILHDDDWLSPDFVKCMLPLVQNTIEFAVCRVEVGVESYCPASLKRWRDSNRITGITVDDLILGSPSPAPGIMVSHALIVRVGGFDPNTYPAGDYLTYIKCVRATTAARLNRTLAYYRTSDSQTFKGNTLRKIIEQSIAIKTSLLEEAGPASLFTYILSMSFWFRVALIHGEATTNIQLDWRLKCAAALCRFRIVTLAAEIVRKAIKFILLQRIHPTDLEQRPL